MSVLTIRLPDDKHDRLRELAKARSVSVNKLMDELATVALANHDARTRFEVRAARGNPAQAMELLARLDAADGVGAVGRGVKRQDLTP
ncbi:MAG: toxin-antitoxin system HicB family antitoxin [Inhella sp.]|jgi:predicted transcriptional regulator|uniref:toxin-antitoxin system HicB family antitoxin n=1 Tax=Inhella sp. TaxID=1921806 RepID=UPI0022C357DA|nr:toxin-antitoxin system HicB family antitoxin [Inhella sp.]MCZ8235333.1 toxin-antitoxin system HicB family antitoxin [Inhella sp.]